VLLYFPNPCKMNPHIAPARPPPPVSFLWLLLLIFSPNIHYCSVLMIMTCKCQLDPSRHYSIVVSTYSSHTCKCQLDPSRHHSIVVSTTSSHPLRASGLIQMSLYLKLCFNPLGTIWRMVLIFCNLNVQFPGMSQIYFQKYNVICYQTIKTCKLLKFIIFH